MRLSYVISCIFLLGKSNSEYGRHPNEDLLDDIKWQFFDDSSCFIDDNIRINGTGQWRGIVANRDFEKGEILVELTPAMDV